MSKNININKKGATNVKLGEGDEEVFDSKNADVIRDESKWDAFQLVGDTNKEEMTHIAQLKHEKSEKEMEKILDRGRAFRIGRTVMMALDKEVA